MLPARAAYSHSASVGNRPPAASQYSRASYQLTPSTGCCGPLKRKSLWPTAFSYAAWVNSVCPSQNPWVILTVTECRLVSPPLHSLSPSEQAISNSPGGIQTYFSPSFGFVHTFPPAELRPSASLPAKPVP